MHTDHGQPTCLIWAVGLPQPNYSGNWTVSFLNVVVINSLKVLDFHKPRKMPTTVEDKRLVSLEYTLATLGGVYLMAVEPGQLVERERTCSIGKTLLKLLTILLIPVKKKEMVS